MGTSQEGDLKFTEKKGKKKQITTRDSPSLCLNCALMLFSCNLELKKPWLTVTINNG